MSAFLFVISNFVSISIAAETRNPRKNMVTAMRTVFFHVFLCYVGLIYVHISSIEARVGAHRFDCWHAHPVQWPSAFYVCHVGFSRAHYTDTCTGKHATQVNHLSFLCLLEQAWKVGAPSPTWFTPWAFHLFSSTSYRECSSPDKRILICERQVVLGLKISIYSRCARTSPKICHDSLP